MTADNLTFAYTPPPANKYDAHVWTAKGPLGAVHVHAHRIEPSGFCPERWWGGVEVHSPKPMYGESTPHHDHCWLLDGPCWHDGSSLYFSENIAWWLDDHPEPFGDDTMNFMQSRLRLFYCNLTSEDAA